jgi:hypothetical protein
MRLPRIPRPAMTVCCSDPLGQLGVDVYSALCLDTLAVALHAMAVLGSEPRNLPTTYIGPLELRLTPTIVRVDGRYWLLREACDECLEVTSRCELETVAALTAAGHRFDASRVRFFHSLPSEWNPDSTMRRVGCGRALLGLVPDPERCGVALPFEPTPGSIPGAKGWATWVAVHVNHLETS